MHKETKSEEVSAAVAALPTMSKAQLFEVWGQALQHAPVLAAPKLLPGTGQPLPKVGG